MIDLYTATTPNGRKISILLEELGLPYEAHAVKLGGRDNDTPEYRKIAPSGMIPAIVERETGFRLMESGAILIWLAEREGRFLPTGAERWAVLEWLFWQVGSVGPIFGQAHHFLRYNVGVSEYGEKRYWELTQKLYGVLDKRLTGRDFVAGDYSIADMAIWPWISRFEFHKTDLDSFPAVRDWYLRIAERPAVQRGYHQPKYVNDIPMP